MDALTGYGSDESSSDSDITTTEPALAQNASSAIISPAQIIHKKNSKDERTSNSLTGLLSGCSRSDEIENENEVNLQTTTNSTNDDKNYYDNAKKRRLSENSSNDKTSSIVNKNALNITIDASSQPKRRRRRRRWDNAEGSLESVNDDTQNNITDESRTLVLPPPRLATDGDKPFDALILFPKDYVTPFCRRRRRKDALGVWRNGKTLTNTFGKDEKKLDVKPSLADKLDSMYKNFYCKSTKTETSKNDDLDYHSSNINSFANHLKSQKEFGNPHLFPSIIKHFGIDPIGSNIPKSLWDPKNDFAPFEFVERIVLKEEENRLRGRS